MSQNCSVASVYYLLFSSYNECQYYLYILLIILNSPFSLILTLLPHSICFCLSECMVLTASSLGNTSLLKLAYSLIKIVLLRLFSTFNLTYILSLFFLFSCNLIYMLAIVPFQMFFYLSYYFEWMQSRHYFSRQLKFYTTIISTF